MQNRRTTGVALALAVLCCAAAAAPAAAKTVNFCGLVASTPAGCLVLRSSTGGRGYEIVGASPRPAPNIRIAGSGTLAGRSACRAMYNRLTSVTWHQVSACPG